MAFEISVFVLHDIQEVHIGDGELEERHQHVEHDNEHIECLYFPDIINVRDLLPVHGKEDNREHINYEEGEADD